ncbi:MAG: hypothetical protein ACYTBJ_04855 [Planctomycetota bacterium]|jgi:hypothetical protein
MRTQAIIVSVLAVITQGGSVANTAGFQGPCDLPGRDFWSKAKAISGGSGLVYFDNIRLCLPRCIRELARVGDFTGDCMVNLRDYSILGGQWLQVLGDPGGYLASGDVLAAGRINHNTIGLTVWPLRNTRLIKYSF